MLCSLLRLSCKNQLCPRYNWTLTPTALTANRLWETFTFCYLSITTMSKSLEVIQNMEKMALIDLIWLVWGAFVAVWGVWGIPMDR